MQHKAAAVLVTGGSGFIGQHVLRRLAADGRTVVAIYHHKLPEALDNVYPVGADIGSPELMAAPLRGVDTVVHLAWSGGLEGPTTPLTWSPDRPEGATLNVRMLANVLTAMERAGTRRIVFVSALGAERQATVAFLREKYLGELLVLNSRVPEKIILRSAVAWGGLGSNDPFVRTLIRVMRYPLYPLPKKLGGLAPIHVQDLAAIVANSCAQPIAGTASVLDVHGGESYALRDLFKIVSETYVKRTRIAVGGFLGESLLPLIERDIRSEPRRPKLSHFLAIGGGGDDCTHLSNPLVAALPARLSTFKERILE